MKTLRHKRNELKKALEHRAPMLILILLGLSGRPDMSRKLMISSRVSSFLEYGIPKCFLIVLWIYENL